MPKSRILNFQLFGFSNAVIRVLTLVIFFILFSCGVTHKVSVPVWEPAPVDLANEIKRIGILNQSLNTQSTESLTGLEAWVAYSDEELSESAKNAALKALHKELLRDSRFDTVIVMSEQNDIGSLSFSDHNTIPWEKMISLCQEFNVDAIFALAHHETDTELSIKKAKIKQKDLVRDNYTIRGNQIKLETLIENGWRIYDPYNKLILDEIMINNQIVSRGEGEDPYQAFESIVDRKDSVIVAGENAGTQFGSRLNPYAETIWRSYYIKGSSNLEKADSLARVEAWKDAAKLWEKDLSHPSPKIRGRAYFNMAVVNELHGDLESARDWAAKSYDIDDTRSTQRYLDDLYYRITRSNLIEEQALNISR